MSGTYESLSIAVLYRDPDSYPRPWMVVHGVADNLNPMTVEEAEDWRPLVELPSDFAETVAQCITEHLPEPL